MSRTNTPDRVLSRFKPSAPSAASHAIVEDTCPSVAAPVFLPRFLSIFPVIMPRNDQVTRQWHVLQRLEGSKHGLTLDELLTALPTDLAKHPRTIRRDLEALEAAHFPLLSERVEGRVRWRLLDGFATSPHWASRRRN